MQRSLTRRERVRGFAKWSGLVASIVIAGMYVTSIRYCFGATYFAGKTFERSLLTHIGAVSYHCASCPEDPFPLGLHGTFARWGVGAFPWVPRWRLTGRSDLVVIPLWLPFVIAVIPTALLFYRDRPAARRAREGLCAYCGYDRRGIADERACPECGRAQETAADQRR